MRSLAFVDLDLTLFDYSSARRAATIEAIRAICRRDQVSELYQFVFSTLIPYGHLLADLGLPNFRRAWRAQELFAFLLALAENGSLRENCASIQRLLAKVDGTRPKDEDGHDHFATRYTHYLYLHRLVADSALASAILGAFRCLENTESKAQLEAAIATFDTVLARQSFLRAGVDELFAALSRHDFETYIVSEGDEAVQSHKLATLGLNGKVAGVFVSGACAESEIILEWLWRTSTNCTAGTKQGDIERIAIGRLYDQVLQYSLKSTKFYYKVAHSALCPPAGRRDFYSTFGWLPDAEWRAQEPIHILLFGDRYDKDLRPGLEAFKDVMAIRLLAGKYRQSFLQRQLDFRNLRHPTAVVESVRDAAILIMNNDGTIRSLCSSLQVPRESVMRLEKTRQSLDCLRQKDPNGFASNREKFGDLLASMLGSN